jgi:hypothetical protein
VGPAFLVNDVNYPVPQGGRAVLYVFDNTLTATPLIIVAPFDTVSWSFSNEEANLGFRALEESDDVEEAGFSLTMRGTNSLVISPAPQGIFTFRARGDGQDLTYDITVVATGSYMS